MYSDEIIRRGEGVVLAILGDAIVSWQAAGNFGKLYACFKIREQPYDILQVVS